MPANTATGEENGSSSDAAADKTSKPQTMCGICGNEVAKYKCPHCPLAFCSVACSRTHRDKHPSPQPSVPSQPALPPSEPPKSQDDHPFSVLDDSVELQRLFAKYPNLPARLEKIYQATLPPKGDGPARGGLPWKLPASGFPGKKSQPWTKEVGLRRAQAALRKARTDPGEDGDGVREYCELITYLLSKQELRDATELVRQEVAEGDAKFIEQLMKAEGR